LTSGVEGAAVTGRGVNVAGVLQARIAAIRIAAIKTRMTNVGFVFIENLLAFNRLVFLPRSQTKKQSLSS
jgi:hypothetical protein